MSSFLTDAEIVDLLNERKLIEDRFQTALTPKKRRGKRFLTAAKEVAGSSGHSFGVYTSLDPTNDMHFSVGLTYAVRAGRKRQPLIRCNGWHGAHRNPIEIRERRGVQVIPANTCHIHRITERYQKFDFDHADCYAEPTTSYNSCAGALNFLIQSFGFCLAVGDRRQPLLQLFEKWDRT